MPIPRPGVAFKHISRHSRTIKHHHFPLLRFCSPHFTTEVQLSPPSPPFHRVLYEAPQKRDSQSWKLGVFKKRCVKCLSQMESIWRIAVQWRVSSGVVRPDNCCQTIKSPLGVHSMLGAATAALAVVLAFVVTFPSKYSRWADSSAAFSVSTLVYLL